MLLACLLAGAGARASSDADLERRVRDAASRLYMHGITAELAESEVGRAGVPTLLRLLDDPGFPRRDNVVAFLVYLGGPESTPSLVRVLDRPLASDARPEDERARWLAPRALGGIAGRGDALALGRLLAMTGHQAFDAQPDPGVDLLEAAIAGLGLAGRGPARDRLRGIADGRIVPDARRPQLSDRARATLEDAEPAAPDASQTAPQPAVAYTPDPSSRSHAHGLTFVNHANVSSPMTSSRLDSALKEATRRAAIADFDGDVACCTKVARSGTGGTFGSSADGLSSIDDESEQNAVIDHPAARVKVVNAINFCGGPATNVIGCANTPGDGMAVVRLSNLDYEAVLWIHEYGHNLGLMHTSSPQAIMYTTDNGMNDGLSPQECGVFHNPSSSARAMISDAGSCTDDGDPIADPIDNCPTVANEAQTDSNGNGIGDACETACGGADPDHDGVCDPDDNCPTVANPGQANLDGDAYGDACELGALRADLDLSGRVDGFDLARLGRAFGASSGDARYDPAADLDRDGQVDGADLALLAKQFGKQSPA